MSPSDPHADRILDEEHVYEGEVVSESTELAVRETHAPATLFNTDDPKAVITKATEVADVLKDVVVKKQLVKKIGQSEYILVEGWTTLGALVGVFPKVEYTREVEDGWEAAVIVVNGNGVEIGRAEAQCLRSERNWKNRDDFAVRSMAQTRAMGKALRMPLGWIAVLAGYEATPAEEMPDDVPFEEGPAVAASQPSSVDGGADASAATQGQASRETHTSEGETQPGTGGGGQFAEEADILAALELARTVGDEARKKLAKGITAQRAEYGDRVKAEWLSKQRAALEAKLPAEQETLV